MLSHYEALCVEPGVGAGGVRRAYLRAAADAHPDRARFGASVTELVCSWCCEMQGGSSEAFSRVQAAYAVLSGAPSLVPLPLASPSLRADATLRAAHDAELAAANVVARRAGCVVAGQTRGHSTSQHGVVAGVSVLIHGQRASEKAPVRRGAVVRDERPLTEDEWAATHAADFRVAMADGDAALAAGHAAVAVQLFTVALRAAAVNGGAAALAQAHAARARAHAAFGDDAAACEDEDAAADEAAAVKPG